jgi:Transglycosylase SLT domain
LIRKTHFAALLVLFFIAQPGQPLAQTGPVGGLSADPKTTICSIIQSTARANALPVDFFMRLIWQESRFRPDEIGPLTHTGDRAQGIAQFMPGTAVERGLLEPFDPQQALPKSAEFLAELREQFGNLGLAAAAYNAGPQRVRDFLAGVRDLPLETRNYVLSVTGHAVEDWVALSKQQSSEVANKESELNTPAINCDAVTLFNRGVRPHFTEMELRNVPSWCRSLSHPNASICGGVHQLGSAPTLVKLRSHLHVSGRVRADMTILTHVNFTKRD